MGLKVILNGKSFYEKFETYGILQRFLNPWYFTEALNPWYLMEVFETHDILQRFLNPWYFTDVLKPMVFNRGYERLFLKFKKISGNTFPMDGLVEETTTLGK